ncbi:hypothetical protein VIOR103205_12605 [Vibrio ordalii]
MSADVENSVAAMVSKASRAMLTEPVGLEPFDSPAAVASSSPNWVGSWPCSNAAKISLISSVISALLPSEFTLDICTALSLSWPGLLLLMVISPGRGDSPG